MGCLRTRHWPRQPWHVVNPHLTGFRAWHTTLPVMHPDLLAALSSASTDSDHLVLGDPSLLWCKHMSSTCHGWHSLPLRFWRFVDSTVACRGTDVGVAVYGRKGKCGQFVFNGHNVRGDRCTRRVPLTLAQLQVHASLSIRLLRIGTSLSTICILRALIVRVGT